MYCTECGTNVSNQKFCGSCGTKIISTKTSEINQYETNNTVKETISIPKETINLSDGIILKSKTPFDNKLKIFNILYLLSLIICFFNPLLGLLLFVVFFMFKDMKASWEVGKIRRMHFACPTETSKNEILDSIMLSLRKLNLPISQPNTFDLRVTHNKIQYDILINESNSTFKIWPQKSLASRLLIDGKIKPYLESNLMVPLLVNTIQSDFLNSK